MHQGIQAPLCPSAQVLMAGVVHDAVIGRRGRQAFANDGAAPIDVDLIHRASREAKYQRSPSRTPLGGSFWIENGLPGTLPLVPSSRLMVCRSRLTELPKRPGPLG
jgi:hypothetical protein